MAAKVSGDLAARFESAKRVAENSKLRRQLKDIPGFEKFIGSADQDKRGRPKPKKK